MGRSQPPSSPASSCGAGDDDSSESSSDDHLLVAIRLAELLREDISPIACLSCSGEEENERNRRPACPCFATLHPFCDLFHSWLSHRLIDDGAGTCCRLPVEVIDEEAPRPERVA